MFIVGLLSWWYGAGWLAQGARVKERVASISDFFSIALLFKTLFNPFRQISAGRVDGPIGVKWHAFLDRLISRCIGAIVRLFMILFGLVSIAMTTIVGLVSLVMWALIPLLPIIGAVMMSIGWVPQWM